MLTIGSLVIRNCPGNIGHGSVGEIKAETTRFYWVKIIEGYNRMEGWSEDAWSKNWCIPYNREPDWEV
jgi:hypothetical protein